MKHGIKSAVTYSDGEDVENTPKELRRSHKSPLSIPHDPRERKVPAIEDEFNDDIESKIKAEDVASEKSSSSSSDEEERGTGSKRESLPAPEPIVIDKEESSPFVSTTPAADTTAWSNVTRDLTREAAIEGEFDDSEEAENVPKSLRRSHKSPLSIPRDRSIY